MNEIKATEIFTKDEIKVIVKAKKEEEIMKVAPVPATFNDKRPIYLVSTFISSYLISSQAFTKMTKCKNNIAHLIHYLLPKNLNISSLTLIQYDYHE